MISKILNSAVFNDYIYPAIISIVFVLSAFYLSDVFDNIYAGIGLALMIICMVSICIEITRETEIPDQEEEQ